MKLKSYAAKTDQGPYLQINEDDFEIDLINKLILIFDGFGGSGIGDKTVSILKDNIKKFYTKIGGDPDSTFPFSYSHKLLVEGNALVNAMEYSHELIKRENSAKEMSKKGGAAAVCAAMADNILIFSSIGNCSVYLYRRGKLELFIRPDNIQFLTKSSSTKQFHSIPFSGFGLFDELNLKIDELRVIDGDLVIMVTDGACSRLDGEEIKYILDRKNISDDQKIAELFSLNNSRGNMDNQSAILLQF